MRILIGPLNYHDHQSILGDLQGFDVRSFDARGADVLYRPAHDTFQELWGRLPATWIPDVLVWWGPESTGVPEGIEECPRFSVAVLVDPELAVSGRGTLEGFDHVFTGRVGVAALHEAGFGRVTRWPVNGFNPRHFRRLPGVERIHDVTVVGSLNRDDEIGSSLRERYLTELSERFNVRRCGEAAGEPYARLLNLSKIVLNRSVRGEMNPPAFEAPASGALLFIEEENLEVRDYFVDRIHCVFYNQENLERLIAHYLARPDERAAIAVRGWQRVQGETFRKHFERLVDLLERYSRGMRPRRTASALAQLATR